MTDTKKVKVDFDDETKYQLIEDNITEDYEEGWDDGTAEGITEESATVAQPKYYFINVAKGGKGAATLIEYMGKYYLVDGGPARNYPILKSSIETITGKKGSKVVLESVVVTHNHSDHINGITKLVSKSGFTIKNIYVSKVVVRKESDTWVVQLQQAYKKKLMRVGKRATVQLAKGTNFSLRLFGPCRLADYWKKNVDKGSQDSKTENNLSMTIKVWTPNSAKNLLIVGDMYYMGISTAADVFTKELPTYKSLFNGKVKYCLYGHHGARGSKDGVKAEAEYYKQSIKATKYIMSYEPGSSKTASTNLQWADSLKIITGILGSGNIKNVASINTTKKKKWYVDSEI